MLYVMNETIHAGLGNKMVNSVNLKILTKLYSYFEEKLAYKFYIKLLRSRGLLSL